MEIRARDINRELLLEFSGEMDHHGARNALKEVEMAIDAALPQTLILDFSGVTFMDSSGHRTAVRSQQPDALLEGASSSVMCRVRPSGCWMRRESGGSYPFNKREVLHNENKSGK